MTPTYVFDQKPALEDLTHYGVKGMKWGVRKERRAANKKAKRAEKAQKHLDKASNIQKEIESLQNRSGRKYTPKTYFTNRKINDLKAKRFKEIRNADAKSKGKLTDTQRNIAMGAAAVGVILATSVAYKVIQSGEGTRLINKGRDFFKDKHDPGWKLDRSLSNSMDSDTIMKRIVSKINPDYGDIGTKMNCRRATFAYEMRRRGYDVRATKTTNSYGQNMIGIHNVLDSKGENLPTSLPAITRRVAKETRSGKTTMTDILLDKATPWGANKVENPSDVFKHLKKMPDGARGELGMGWLAGGGHSMSWEIIKGKPVIFDNQTGEKFDSLSSFKKTIENAAEFGYTRLDDKTLDMDYLMRWTTNA